MERFTIMTELKDMKKEDILNPELIGNGIPDLETEIAKLKNGTPEQEDSGFGFGGNDGGFFGESQDSNQDSIFGGNQNDDSIFGGNQNDDSDIFGFGSKKKVEEEEQD